MKTLFDLQTFLSSEPTYKDRLNLYLIKEFFCILLFICICRHTYTNSNAKTSDLLTLQVCSSSQRQPTMLPNGGHIVWVPVCCCGGPSSQICHNSDYQKLLLPITNPKPKCKPNPNPNLNPNPNPS